MFRLGTNGVTVLGAATLAVASYLIRGYECRSAFIHQIRFLWELQ
ncbi:hypothetical protein ACP70R_029339 [Stipagrostis hirtigluma subsp. patula]